MTNRQLKKKIREAFSHGTPDISQEIVIDTLFSDPQDQQGVEISVEAQRKPIRFPIFSVAAAACAAIAVLAISINLIANRPQSGSAAFITPDEALNAVHAYFIDRPAVTVAPNTDCKLDADDTNPHYDVTLNYGGLSEYKFVVDARTGEVLSMEENQLPFLGGFTYLTEEQAKEIALADASVNASQITEYTCKREIIDAVLHYHISFRLVNALYDYKVSAVTGGIQDSYILNAAKFITESSAKSIALASVRLTASEITDYSIDFKSDGQRSCYNIIFIANNLMYRFEIDAITGNVLDISTDSVNITLPTPSVVVVLPVEVALKHAGVTLEEIVNLKCEEDTDDEVPHIDVSFIANVLKYEYDVKAGGTILDFKTEPMEDDFISPSEATAMFYEYLNVTPAPLAINLTYNLAAYQGRMCYDIIHTNSDGSDIRMKIDAETGELLLKEIPDGLQPLPTPPDGKLSADQATSIALNQIGLTSEEQVTDFELQEDRDDNPPHYEISFHYQGYEYSFKIGMYDGGRILDSKKSG